MCNVFTCRFIGKQSGSVEIIYACWTLFSSTSPMPSPHPWESPWPMPLWSCPQQESTCEFDEKKGTKRCLLGITRC